MHLPFTISGLDSTWNCKLYETYCVLKHLIKQCPTWDHQIEVLVLAYSTWTPFMALDKMEWSRVV